MKVKLGKINEIIFFIAYGIYLVFLLLSQSLYYSKFYGYKYNIIKGLIYLLLMLSLITTKKMKYREFLGVLILFVLLFILSFNQNVYFNFLVIFPLLYVARNIDFLKIGKFTLAISILVFMFIVISSKLGIIDNYIYFSTSGRIRQYLGFRYSLYPSSLLSNIIMLYFYVKIKEHKIKILDYVIAIAVNYVIYSLTRSRLVYYIDILFLLIIFIFNLINKKKIKKLFIYRLLPFSFIVCTIFSIIIASIYDNNNSKMKKIDDFFEQRISMSHYLIENDMIKPLGMPVEYRGNGLDVYGNQSTGEYFFIDCMYLNIMNKYGYIIMIILLIGITKGMRNAYKEENYLLLIILTIIAFYGLIDNLKVDLYYNTFWFALIPYLIKKNENKEEVE